MASIALLVLPLSHFFVPGEQMTLRRTIGFLIGFGGVALLIGPEALAPSGSDMELWGACFACGSILLCRFIGYHSSPSPIDPLGLAAIPLIIGAITSLCFALSIEGRRLRFRQRHFGLFCTWAWSQRRVQICCAS